ncbi:Organic cation transporter protein [Trichinella pseudospiralis]|uniref:Organic cation transporter protein n=1 Tax=Trichinella pseudospiralis TaxID=6337 RepID=A0A0V1IEP3_TRIPS|nr:Organic cation transporter protein [Trichinella pseudospiralis]
MKFEDLLRDHVGEFGPYQQVQYFLVNLPVIITAMHVLSWTFTSEVLPHRCLYVGENDTAPYELATNWSLKLMDESGSSCLRYKNVSYSQETIPEDAELESCIDGYRWKPSTYTSTAVTKWSLVCDQKWIRSFIQSVYHIGQFLGSFICGTMSDRMVFIFFLNLYRFGRKVVFFLAIILQMFCGCMIAVVPYWPLVALFRTGLGFSHPGLFLIAVVIGTELVGPKQRIYAGVGSSAFFSLGQVFLGAVAYLFSEYQHLQLAISIPGIIFFSYWWLVPESARWLLSKRRYKEAAAILQRAAKFNGRTVSSEIVESIELVPISENGCENKRRTATAADLFRSQSLRKRTLVAIAVACVYYALSINPSFLGGDINLSFIIGGFLELPFLVVVLLAINRIGRRWMLIVGFVLCASLMLFTLVVPAEYKIIKLLLVLLAKSALASVYAINYTYTSELFPTVLRNTAMGLCSMIGRIGSFAASYFALWLAEDYAILMSLLYSAIALIAGGLCLLLPETAGHDLAETLADAEKFSNRRLNIPQRKKQSSPSEE